MKEEKDGEKAEMQRKDGEDEEDECYSLSSLEPFPRRREKEITHQKLTTIATQDNVGEQSADDAIKPT